MSPIEMRTSRLVLREFETTDTESVYQIIGDDRVTHFLSFNSRTKDDARRMIEDAIERRTNGGARDEYYLAITHKDDGRLVGFSRLGINLGSRAAKLGYAIMHKEWGCGYAKESVGVTVDFAFASLMLHRVSAAIGPDNYASMRVVESLGFTEEGRIRGHVHTNGAWRDSILFSRLETDIANVIV